MGAMRAHHSDLEKTEKPNDDGDPGHQRPGPKCEYAGSSDDKPGKTNQEKVSQLLQAEMAVNLPRYRAIFTVGSYTGGNGF
jgi:hypothetical protein